VDAVGSVTDFPVLTLEVEYCQYQLLLFYANLNSLRCS